MQARVIVRVHGILVAPWTSDRQIVDAAASGTSEVLHFPGASAREVLAHACTFARALAAETGIADYVSHGLSLVLVMRS
jgi:hypothetical protein